MQRPGTSLIWDAMEMLGAYALAMWPVWAPVLAAIAWSLGVRATRSCGRDLRRLDRVVMPGIGIGWLLAVAGFIP